VTVIATGGAGFIGSNFVRGWTDVCDETIVNVDQLTYAGNVDNIASLKLNSQHVFKKANICDNKAIRDILASHQPRAIVHFAAESHVDRSISSPENFIDTNIVGTFNLLEETRKYWLGLSAQARESFRFLHISTDEVYGSLSPTQAAFTEESAYAPNSPYSASKAASDHLVRAYFHTYKLPVITSNCSNNYGPNQFPEKFIPLIILNAMVGKDIPVYGNGENIRDWLYVGDHCDALRLILSDGHPGETYNVGGNTELTNIAVAKHVCEILDVLHPQSPTTPHASLIKFVGDRPGHDFRYAVDTSKIADSLGWAPKQTFSTGLEKTIRWYLDNGAWIDNVRSGKYLEWLSDNYDQRAKTQ
jgi:dTDP-glucose 4,6-dehydratase